MRKKTILLIVIAVMGLSTLAILAAISNSPIFKYLNTPEVIEYLKLILSTYGR